MEKQDSPDAASDNPEQEGKHELGLSSSVSYLYTPDRKEEGDGKQEQTFWRTVSDLIRNITLEPMIFVFSIAKEMTTVILQNLKLERFCTLNMNYTQEECDLMNDFNHTDMQEEAQVLENTFTFYEKVVSVALPLIFLVFMGSWSDRHGRKPLILACLAGYILYSTVYLLEAVFTSWPVWVLLVGYILQSAGGGYAIFLLSTYSFISDRTTRKDRTTRMMFMASFLNLGSPIGSMLGVWLYDVSGYISVFSSALGLFVLCFIYTIVLLRDRIPPNKDLSYQDKTGNRKCGTCLSIFDIEHAMTIVRAGFRRRPNRDRAHLWVGILLMLLYISGAPHNVYLWTMRVLGWEEGDYSLWLSVDRLFHQVAMLCMAPLLVGRDDHLVGAVWAMMSLGRDLLLSCVTRPQQWWAMYVSTVISFCPLMLSATIRSILTKICNADEVGSVFSLMAIMEIIYPLVDKVIYVSVYNASIDTYPSAQYLVGVGFNVILVATFFAFRFSMQAVKRKIKNSDTCERY